MEDIPGGFQVMCIQKHDSGVRTSELGVSGERRVLEGKVERKSYRCGGVDILNGRVQERSSPGL